MTENETRKRRREAREKLASLITGSSVGVMPESDVQVSPVDDVVPFEAEEVEREIVEAKSKEEVFVFVNDEMIPVSANNDDLSDVGQVSSEEWDKQSKLAKEIMRLNVPSRVMSDEEVREGVKFLQNPDLLPKVLDEIGKRVTGEYYARAMIFLCSCGIWNKKPLQMTHSLVNSVSSAGKDWTVKAVWDIFPADLKEYRTKITPEVFTYWKAKYYVEKMKKYVNEDWTWDGKLLYLEDCSQALLDSATFRIMLSGGTHSTIIKDQMARDIEIKGRPLTLITTATTRPSNELLNRFLPVSLDESEEQTINVFNKEIETVEGKQTLYDTKITNALRLLSRCEVIIPFAKQLGGIFPPNPVNMRREFGRFLTLIQNSATLHQYQREKDEEGRIIANWKDYDNAVLSFGGKMRTPVKLTRSQQKVYDSFPDSEWYLKDEVATFSNFRESWTYDLLMQLSERELIEVRLDETEAKNKRKQQFRIKREHSVLPTSEQLSTIIKEKEEGKTEKTDKTDRVGGS